MCKMCTLDCNTLLSKKNIKHTPEIFKLNLPCGKNISNNDRMASFSMFPLAIMCVLSLHSTPSVYLRLCCAFLVCLCDTASEDCTPS